MEPIMYYSEKEKFILLIFEIEKKQSIEEVITSTYYLKTEGVLTEIPLENYFNRFPNNNKLFRLVAKVEKNVFELIEEIFSTIKTFSELKEANYKIEFNEDKKYFVFQRDH